MKTVDFLKPEEFPQNKDRKLIHFTTREVGKKCYSVKLKRSVRFGSSGR